MNVKKFCFVVFKVGSGEKKIDMVSFLRGVLMVYMVVGVDVVVVCKI